MSLAYPVARSLDDALSPGAPAARSKREALAMSAGLSIEGLETSWLHLSPEETDALFKRLGAEGAAGHVQRYEDTSGHTVVAISWWKLVDPNRTQASERRTFEPAPPPPPAEPQEDHTDDLYFRRGRTKSRKRKPIDPNQMNLFGE